MMFFQNFSGILYDLSIFIAVLVNAILLILGYFTFTKWIFKK